MDPAQESAIQGMPQSWNRYAYGLASPLLYVDEDGRSAALAIGAAPGVPWAGISSPAVAAPAVPLLAAGAVGVGLGYLANQIPGVSEALTNDAVSDQLSTVLYSSKADASRRLVHSKLLTVQQHIMKYPSPDRKDPDDESKKRGVYNRMRRHLDQAKDRLKRLPPKQREALNRLIRHTEDQLERWWSGGGR